MKKRKLIFSLIILVVILSSFLVSSFPVSAAELEFRTVTYSGQDLIDFLNIFDVQLVASDFQDFSEAYVVPTSSYQLFFHKGINDAYILINFPDIHDYYVENKALKLRFNSKIDVFAKNWYSESYKRKVTNNGDFSSDYSSVGFSTGVRSPIYYGSDHTDYFSNTASITQLYDMSYPYFNGYTDPNTGFYYINETKPFSNGDKTAGYFHANSYRSILNLDFSDDPDGYRQITSFSVNWNGIGYSAGAIIIGLKPITITLTDEGYTEIQSAINELKDFYTNSTPEQNSQVSSNNNKNNSLKNDGNSINTTISDGMNASIGGMSIDDLTPSFWDFSISSDPLLLEGSNLWERLTSRLYSNTWYSAILVVCILPIVAGYLVYGKKG